MQIDEHFGFIATSWGMGLVAIGGLWLVLWLQNRALKRELATVDPRTSQTEAIAKQDASS